MDERHNQLSEADQRVVAMAEAEIRRALSVEPSPEFPAKVRARIAAEPRRSFGWRPWLTLAAASIVVAVAALVMLELRPAKPQVAPLTAAAPQPSPPQPRRAVAESLPPRVVPPALATRPSSVHRAAAAVRAGNDETRNEVLIDPAQAAAISRLFAMTQRGVTLPEGGDKEMVVPGELLVSPLVVEPLQVRSIAAEQGPGSR